MHGNSNTKFNNKNCLVVWRNANSIVTTCFIELFNEEVNYILHLKSD